MADVFWCFGLVEFMSHARWQVLLHTRRPRTPNHLLLGRISTLNGYRPALATAGNIKGRLTGRSLHLC